MAKAQRELKGMERPKLAAVEDAAEAFVDASERLKEVRDKREAASAQLIAEMKAAKVSAYKFDSKVVTVSAKARVTVKDADEDSDDE